MKVFESVIYWSCRNDEGWSLAAAATAKGLCYSGTPEDFMRWVKSRGWKGRLVQDGERLAPFLAQFVEYLRGERKEFTLPLDLRGTDFQRAVWDELRRIPYGQTCSYSDLAARLGRPLGARAVGAAVGANPLMIVIPCHRVIGKGGALAGYRGGLEMKRKLLQLEGALPL